MHSRVFQFLGGQLPATCEHCDVCTIHVTGKDTSFWNIHVVRHSFIIHTVLAVFLGGISIRTYVVSNIANYFVTSAVKGLFTSKMYTQEVMVLY